MPNNVWQAMKGAGPPEVESWFDHDRDLVQIKIRRWQTDPEKPEKQIKWGVSLYIPLERMYQVAEAQCYPQIKVPRHPSSPINPEFPLVQFLRSATF